MEGCLIGCMIGSAVLVLAVPLAVLVVIAQGSAKRKAWQIVRGERDATVREIDQCLRTLGPMKDAEAIELVRRLSNCRDEIARDDPER